jgi:carbohydrate-binding DOMON domain-containing protein
MGIATVHYLSMNVRDGQVALDHAGTDYEDVEYTYELTSLQPELDYVIDWGDESTDEITTDVDGAYTATHTYADPDTYTITVTRVDTEQIAAQETVVIAVD